MMNEMTNTVVKKVRKGVWRMPRLTEAMKDVISCAYLHDIGKIGIPDQILNKPGKLTQEEFNLIKQHTIIGQDIVKDITIIPHLDEVTRSHHEHYDGSGYPDGLKGNEIPIQARIIAIVDSYDAMNSRRIYRNALSFEQIKEQIKKKSGTQFDPEKTCRKRSKKTQS